MEEVTFPVTSTVTDNVWHHTCKCLNRSFTWEEFNNFDRIHFHAKSIILHTTSDGFGFNINDICMNPHNVSYRFLHGISVNITTAKSDNGRWDYGIVIKFKSCEYSRLVCYVDNEMKGYQNESSAIHSALNEADWFFRRKFNKYPNLLRAVLNRIVKLKSIYEPRQLSLFY